jgi:hypothetical protein
VRVAPARISHIKDRCTPPAGFDRNGRGVSRADALQGDLEVTVSVRFELELVAVEGFGPSPNNDERFVLGQPDKMAWEPAAGRRVVVPVIPSERLDLDRVARFECGAVVGAAMLQRRDAQARYLGLKSRTGWARGSRFRACVAGAKDGHSDAPSDRNQAGE